MAKKLSKYYFNRACTVYQTPKEWRAYMIQNNIAVLRLYQAKIVYNRPYNICKLLNETVTNGKAGQCNTKCPHYESNKNYRCKHYGYIYEPTNILFTLSVQKLERIGVGKQEQRAIDVICQRFMVDDPKILYRRTRKTNVVHARHLLMLLYVYQFQHPIKLVARHFGLHGSNFYHALKTVIAEYETSNIYRDCIDTTLQQIGLSSYLFILTLNRKRAKMLQKVCAI